MVSIEDNFKQRHGEESWAEQKNRLLEKFDEKVLSENRKLFKEQRLNNVEKYGCTPFFLDFCDNRKCWAPFQNQTETTTKFLDKMVKCTNCTATHEMQQFYDSYSILSKFAIVVHGDSSTTSRLYDAVANLQIPVILSPTIYYEGLPFLTSVPWSEFCIFIDPVISPVEEVAHRLAALVNQKIFPKELLRYKFEVLKRHRADVLWHFEHSRVFDRILEEKANQRCR